MSDDNGGTAAATTTTLPPPTNPLVTALLTDLYQITMTYAHWKNHRHHDPAVFELFFRENPFKGEYTIFAGLDECLKFLTHFRFTQSDVDYLRQDVPQLAHCDAAFFEWLLHDVNTSQVTVHAMRDGTVVFPRLPLLVIEAPLAIGQLLETTLLTLVNYPSLLATNAARMVRAATQARKTGMMPHSHPLHVTPSSSAASLENPDSSLPPPLPAQCYETPICIEFGLRRAQGPDGGMSASKYAVLGGFAGTSNVQAGKYFDVKLSGTHAHAFVQAYSSLDEVKDLTIVHKQTKDTIVLLPKVLEYRKSLAEQNSRYKTTNDGELAAFIAYAMAFPDSFLCLIDTYDTLQSGLFNFVLVALVLDDCGYQPVGIRLDSGDLAFLSMECAKFFASHAAAASDGRRSFFHRLSIVASNDINEAILHSLHEQGHAITGFGIGTNLVTCQAQPALGCVYKLVEISGKPRMKLSQDIGKVLIPGRKKPYRLYGREGHPLLDVMQLESEEPPAVGQRILCRHPFLQRKMVVVTPSAVEPLHTVVFAQGHAIEGANRSLLQARAAVSEQLDIFRPDILRYVNPTPYKISISSQLYDYFVELWQNETPVMEMS